MVKRFCDILFSITGLLILAPFFLIIALLIKLDSRGPVFYSGTRIGKDGKPFKMWKFLTMRKFNKFVKNSPGGKVEMD